ncbi:MAG TPA: non-heme iron oxygenase ferredoxin subunit [Marmoricola sp.]|nr:non-heme iron oxygenase ferredoxin subunit [Marmoricola sp.]
MGFQRVCAQTDLADDQPKRVEVDGIDVVVVRTDGEVFALEDECSHAAVALSEGEVADCAIECWMHGSRFDLRSGHPLGPPATEPVATFAVRLSDDDVFVDVDAPAH